MPHSRSSAAAARRRLRAQALGFLRPRPSGCRFLRVPVHLVGNAKVIIRALVAHSALDAVTGERHHLLRGAVHAAEPILEPESVDDLRSLNRAAGRAKHFVPAAPALSARARGAAPRADGARHILDPAVAVGAPCPEGGAGTLDSADPGQSDGMECQDLPPLIHGPCAGPASAMDTSDDDFDVQVETFLGSRALHRVAAVSRGSLLAAMVFLDPGAVRDGVMDDFLGDTSFEFR